MDLSGVTEYPLSLNALLAEAAPAVEAPVEDAEAPAENAAEESEEAEADAEPTEAAEWHIEYDEALLSVEEAEGDYLVTPLQRFEATEITVDNGSRYALTLVNCALPEEEEAAEAPAIAYPAQDFEGRTEYVAVAVSAPEGAFPEGTTMAVADVEDEKTLTDIEDTVSEEFVEVKRVHAVDITFTDAEGNEIEPLLPISVVMRVEEKEQQQQAVVVHVDDAGETEVVDSQSEAPAGETEVKVEMPATEAPAEEASEATEAEETSVGFEADTFSVYAVVITETIETKYIDAEGATWNISVGYGPEAGIPAGATLAVEEVEGDYLEQTAELLKGKETITLARFFDITILDAEGNAVQPAQPVEVKATLAEQSADAVKAVHFAEAGPEIIEASQADETVSFDAASFSVYGIVYTVDFHYGVDGETYEFTLPGGGAVGMRELAPALGLVEDTEDAVDLFARSVENVAFSDESLVKAVPVEMNMTVGALKQKYELESEYSAELTEEQIAELNDKVLQAPDWALVSLKPFDTEETLTVALATGETFTVTVTDAQLTRTVIAASGEAYEITVTYGDEAEIPEGAELKVREILPEDEEYAGYLAAARRATSGEADAGEEAEADAEESEQPEADYARFFDIEIWADEQKVEPAAPVTVDITLADAPQTTEALQVVHFDEADGPVVMQTEAGEEGEDEAVTEAVTEAAKVRFETDSFSVYAVIGVDQPQTVTDLNGWAFTINRESQRYVTNTVNTSDDPNKLGKTTDPSKAAVWVCESDGNGRYYISTVLANGQKQYMHMTYRTNQTAHVTLSDSPQSFLVRKNGNNYQISANIGGVEYYLNEWDHAGGNGFAAHSYEPSEDNKMSLVFKTAPVVTPGNKYAVIIKNDQNNKYYAVQNNGSLVEVEYSVENNVARVKLDYPLIWTYTSAHDGLDETTLHRNDADVHQDWSPYNIRVSVDCRQYNGYQLPEGNYFRYLSPQNENGLDTESATNANHTTSKWYNGLQYVNNHICGLSYTNNNWSSNGKYIGADFTNMKVTGNNSESNAATVFLAKIEPETIPSYSSNNEAVSHIDISIKGQGVLDVPLAYGTYYDKDRKPILTVEKGEDVTLHLEQPVPIVKEDIMAADVTAYDKNGTPLDDAFFISGYTSNEQNTHSEVQVRMEGSFKVDTLNPSDYTGSEWLHNLDENWRNQRLNNQVYYRVATLKEVPFNLVYNGQQLYDKNGKELIVKAKVRLSAGFSYWDPNNECPPVLYDFEEKYNLRPHGEPEGHNKWWWEHGAIIDNDHSAHYPDGNGNPNKYGVPGDSGMDFRLGSQDDSQGKVVAVEIVKIIESESGERIYPDRDVKNSFVLNYNADDLPSNVRTTGIPSPVDSASLSYSGYTRKLDTQTVVGGDGVGATYEYDVNPGMFYVTEDQTSLQEGGENYQITDKQGNDWTYKETRIETEYVKRDNEYDGRRHVANGYSSVPEVLGDYLDDHSQPQKNEFLEFYVYNVYKATPTKLNVEKEWKGYDPIPTGATVNAVLKRYRLTDDVLPAEKGNIFISQRLRGQTSKTSFSATYTLKKDGNAVGTVSYDSKINGARFTNLEPGEYTVEIQSSVGDGYEVENVPTACNVTVTAGDTARASFTSTIDAKSPEGQTRIVYVHSSEERDYIWDPNNEGKYVYKKFIEYPVGTQVTITFDNGSQDYNPYYGHHLFIDGVDQGEINSSKTSFVFTVQNSIYPLQICVSDTTQSNYMNIMLDNVMKFSPEGTVKNGLRSGTVSNAGMMTMAPRLISASAGVTNNGTAPISTTVGKHYVVDEDWSYTVQLTSADSWKKLVQDVDGLVKHDSDGNEYLYFIASVTESGVPEGTTARIVNKPDGSVLTAKDGTLVLKAANIAPTKAQIKGVKQLTHGDDASGYSFTLTAVNNAPIPSNGTTATSGSDGKFEFGEIIYPFSALTDDVNNAGSMTKDFTYTVAEVVPEPEVTAEERASGHAIRSGIKYDLTPITVTVTVSYDATNGTMSASVSPDQAGLVITNEKLGSLQVTKTVKLNGEADATHGGEALTFYVGMFNSATDVAAISGTVKPIQVESGASTGVVTYDNLTIGNRYYVYETDSTGRKLEVNGKTNGYHVTANGGMSDAITLSPIVNVGVENEKRTGDLELTKRVAGEGADTNKTFEFSIALTAPQGETLAASYSASHTGDANVTIATVVNGVVSGISLKAGEVYTIQGLPDGTGYTINETDYSAEGYTANSTGTDSMSGTIVGGSSQKKSVEVTNTLSAGGLTVEKTVTGNAGDATKAFSFTATFEKTGLAGDSGNWQKDTEEATSITFNDGTAKVEFSLRGGEKVSFNTLPEGTTFTVVENSADRDGYETSVTATGAAVDGKQVSGTISTSAAATVYYNNNKESTTAEAVKQWKSGTQEITWPVDVQSVSFTLYKTVNGSGSLVTANDLIYFATAEEIAGFQNPQLIDKDTQNHKASWDKLPGKYLVSGTWYPATYTVKETAITYTGQEATQIEAIAAVDGVVTNEIPKVDIHATKEWKNKDDSTTPPEGAQVTFTLLADGVPTAHTVLVDGVDETVANATPANTDYEGEGWTAWFTQLPKYTDAGTLVSYTVKETGKWTNYEPENGVDTAENNGAITNVEQTGKLKVTKEIHRAGALSDTATGSFRVGIFRMTENEGVWTPATTAEDSKVIEVTAGGTNSVEFDNLRIGDRYAVYELDASGNIFENGAHTGVYTVGYANNTGLTIALDTTPEAKVVNDQELVDIDVAKTWMNGERDVTATLKNASVTFLLEKSIDGETWTEVESKTISTTDEAKDAAYWTASWRDLSKCENGVVVQYRASETVATVNGVNAIMPQIVTTTFREQDFVSKAGHDNPTAITGYINKLPTTDVTVRKTWSSTANWPDPHIQVSITLKADGETPGSMSTYTVTVHDEESGEDRPVPMSQYATIWLTADDAVQGHIWLKLPMYTDAGAPITYTVVEDSMRYQPDEGGALLIANWAEAFTTTGGAVENDVAIIDNTPKETSIDVTKAWKLNGTDKVFNEATEISYALYKASATEALTVDAANITADKGDVEAGKVRYVTGENAGWQTVTISRLPKYELVIDTESGTATATYSPVNYYVTETGVTGDTRVTYQAENGEETETASDANTNDGTITIYNRDAQVDINVLKVDATNASKKLKDAEFQILKYKDDSEQYVAYDFVHKAFVATVSGDASTQNAGDSSKQKTNDAGELSFTGLPAGQYKLVETKTPDGYIKVDNNDIYFTVFADGTVKWTKADGTTEIGSGTAVTEKPNQVDYNSTNKTFTVGNNPGAKLPSTGGRGTTLYHALGTLLMLGAAILLVVKKRMQA